MAITLNINGTRREFDGDPNTPLLGVIREDLGLTGTKYGCGIAQCGACTVHVDGQTLRSCSAPVSAVANRQVTTIEGLSSRAAKAVQKAWVDLDVVQCGLLPVGADHVGDCPAREKAQAERHRYQSRDGRQHLSLRDLPAHPRGHPRRVDAARRLKGEPCIP